MARTANRTETKEKNLGTARRLRRVRRWRTRTSPSILGRAHLRDRARRFDRCAALLPVLTGSLLFARLVLCRLLFGRAALCRRAVARLRLLLDGLFFAH